MDGFVVVHVEFPGNRDPEENVLRVQYNIAWVDFQLMLKLTYESEEIVVKYKDEDDEYVTISSQEELAEAFKVARKFENTLNLLVLLDFHLDDLGIPRPEVRTVTVFNDGGTSSDIEADRIDNVIADDEMSAAVELTASSTECSLPVSTSTEETVVAAAADSGSPDVVSNQMDTDVACADTQPAASVQPESVTDNLVSMETELSTTSSDPCSSSANHSITRRRCFVAKNKACGKVLDVCGWGKSAGTPLILWDEKPPLPGNANQMFYIDRETGTIRSRASHLCIDVHGTSSALQTYSNAKMSQSWTIQGDRICQCHNHQWNLAMALSECGTPIITATDAQEIDEHRWLIKFIDGEYFVAKNVASGLVLDAKGGGTSPGTELIFWQEKSGLKYEQNRNQLFYEHPESGTIVSLLSHLTINISGASTPMLAPYSNSSSAEQWVVDGERICLKSCADVVLMYQPGVKGGLSTGTYEGCNDAQHWLITYIEVPDETNGESGEAAAAMAANRAIVEGFWNIMKEGDRPRKKKVKDYYAQLARDVGRHTAASRVRSWQAKSGRSSVSRENSTCESEMGEANMHANAGGTEEPPAWFYAYMNQFRRALAEDVATLVDSRNSSPVTSRTTSVCEAMPAAAAETLTHPELRFEHFGVLCDNCNGSVTGIRYKCCNCENFDLCEVCEALDGIHNSSHVFLKIRRPTMLVGLDKWGHAEPILKSSIYLTDAQVHGKLMNIAHREEMREEKKRLQQMKDEKKQEKKQAKKQLKAEQKTEKKEAKKRRKEQMKSQEEEQLRQVQLNTSAPQLNKEKVTQPIVMRMNCEFVRDTTISDGTHLQPRTKFMKKWIIKNTGTHAWTPETKLVFLWGNIPTSQTEIPVPCVQPGDAEVEISAEMTAPNEPGVYQSHMQLSHQGARFGHRVWCSIIVDPPMLLEPSQDSTENQSLLKVADIEQSVEMKKPEVVVEDENRVKEQQVGMECSASQSQSGDFELVTQHPEMFEMLELSERRQPRVSQTATPNNTPLDLSPPKSPVGELDSVMKRLSTSSSVEPVTDSSPDEAGVTMNELVQERIASLGLKPDVFESEDVETMSTCSEDSDSDSDFYIVPLPDCFNVNKPISNTTSTSIIISKDDLKKKKKSVDDLLWASCKLDTPMLEPESMESSDTVMIEHQSADEDEEEFKEAETELPSPGDGEASPDMINRDEYENIPGGDDVTSETDVEMVATSTVITDTVSSVSCSVSSASSCTVTTTSTTDGDGICTTVTNTTSTNEISEPYIVAVTRVEASDDAASPREGPVQPTAPAEETIEPSPSSPLVEECPSTASQTEVKTVQTPGSEGSPSDVNGNEENGEEPAPDPEVPTLEAAAATTPKQTDAFSSAITGVLGVATHAAATAISTAKDVIQNLQQRNQYVPPQSTWTPPPSTWTPPPETPWTPPTATWTYPQSDQEVVVPAPATPPLQQLIEMGFANRELNAELLVTHNNDLNRVIQDLIQRDETNNWADGRH